MPLMKVAIPEIVHKPSHKPARDRPKTVNLRITIAQKSMANPLLKGIQPTGDLLDQMHNFMRLGQIGKA